MLRCARLWQTDLFVLFLCLATVCIVLLTLDAAVARDAAAIGRNMGAGMAFFYKDLIIVDGFARWLPRAVVAVRYTVSFYLLAPVHQNDMPVGIISGWGSARWGSL